MKYTVMTTTFGTFQLEGTFETEDQAAEYAIDTYGEAPHLVLPIHSVVQD